MRIKVFERIGKEITLNHHKEYKDNEISKALLAIKSQIKLHSKECFKFNKYSTEINLLTHSFL
jgi:hypothetical protein